MKNCKMPCGCSITKKESGFRTVILRNPKNGKKVTEIKIPKMVSVRQGPQLLPGSRIIKPETYMKYVQKPRRLMI